MDPFEQYSDDKVPEFPVPREEIGKLVEELSYEERRDIIQEIITETNSPVMEEIFDVMDELAGPDDDDQEEDDDAETDFQKFNWAIKPSMEEAMDRTRIDIKWPISCLFSLLASFTTFILAKNIIYRPAKRVMTRTYRRVLYGPQTIRRGKNLIPVPTRSMMQRTLFVVTYGLSTTYLTGNMFSYLNLIPTVIACGTVIGMRRGLPGVVKCVSFLLPSTFVLGYTFKHTSNYGALKILRK